jgi:hypothetical protein
MLANLLTPGGRIGYVTAAIAFLLAIGGLTAIVMLGTGVWAETAEDRIAGVVFGLIMLVGVAGLVIQPQRPVLGAILAVLGSVAGALFYFWALFPFLLIPMTIVTVILRARRLSLTAGSVALENGSA